MFEKQLTRTKVLVVVAIAVTVCWKSMVVAQDLKPDDEFVRQYWTDAAVYSLRAGDELATYKSHSGGGVGPNGTLGLGVQGKQRQFEVSIQGKLKARRFLASVSVKPHEADTRTQAKELEYDLSDLNSRSLEIGRDDDGRVYWLSLRPKIIEHPKPKQFKASDFQLETWSFPASPVIVNDQDYIGRLSMSHGPIAWCDIPGLAKIEFSLLHLKDALPLGTLEDGVINLAHQDGTTLRISNVKNGVNDETLGGGPYRVWVRWDKPSESMAEYRESLSQQIARLKERVASGDLVLPIGTLARLEQMRESGRIGLTENGVRGAESGDLADPGQ